MSRSEIAKFEFVLTLGDNIIVQRYFTVKDYNPNTKKSIDIYDAITDICYDIGYDLKEKTSDFLYNSPTYNSPSDKPEEIKHVEEEFFKLEIKYMERVFISKTEITYKEHPFISRIFPAHVYHPNVRYSVDIRPKLRGYLGDLTDMLSTKTSELDRMYHLKEL